MSDKRGKKPDFIGIGATKAATFWIYFCLKEHPEICVSNKKEIHFFDRLYNYNKGIEYYYSFFKHCPNQKIKGEFTPSYIMKSNIPFLIYKHFPNIKLFACLRNPIDKIYSEYRYQINMKQRLWIYRSFEEAIVKNHTLVEEGYYYKQLKKYFELFPREKILIMFYEDLIKNPILFLKKLYTFLGVKNIDFIPSIVNNKKNVTGTKTEKHKIPIINYIIYKALDHFGKDSWLKNFLKIFRIDEFLAQFLEFNSGIVFRNIRKEENIYYPPINETTRKYLIRIYKEENEKLENLLKRNLSFWK